MPCLPTGLPQATLRIEAGGPDRPVGPLGPVIPAQTFDVQELMSRVGDDPECWLECIAGFLEASPQWLTAVCVAVERRDGKALERVAHRLKNAARNFGLNPTVSAALEVEILGRQGRLAEVVPAVRVLRIELQRLQAALAAFASREVFA